MIEWEAPSLWSASCVSDIILCEDGTQQDLRGWFCRREGSRTPKCTHSEQRWSRNGHLMNCCQRWRHFENHEATGVHAYITRKATTSSATCSPCTATSREAATDAVGQGEPWTVHDSWKMRRSNARDTSVNGQLRDLSRVEAQHPDFSAGTHLPAL